MQISNPFACDSATAFSVEDLAKIYVDDYNCSGLIRSKKNLILVGERGSGKSMSLLYNSLKCQHHITNKWPQHVGIYIPCKTELSLSADVYLYEEKINASLAEHYLCIVIAHSAICEFLDANVPLPKIEVQQKLIEELSYSYFDEIPFRDNLYRTLKSYYQREVQRVKRLISDLDNTNKLLAALHSFQSLILPLFDILDSIYPTHDHHFCLMFDDAYKFNSIQKKVLNTYFSYRNRSRFSIKAALASTIDYDFKTTNSVSILKGHDYDLLCLEGDFQNSRSDFYRLATDVLRERIKLVNPKIDDVDTFFPYNTSFICGLEQSKAECKAYAAQKYPDDFKKQNDHVYKYGVVQYYASRVKTKANHPPYSGLEIITGVSTGVLRQLLLPCCLMYERAIAKSSTPITHISPEIQTAVLSELSNKLWKDLEEGTLYKTIDGCTREQSQQLYNFLNALGDLFRERLIENKSEPRAVVFTISEKSHPHYDEIKDVLDIGRRALLIFTREGSAKESSRRQTYYTPNRLLWISRGLDPTGQHSRVSIKASQILNAMKGDPIKVHSDPFHNLLPTQGSLFNE